MPCVDCSDKNAVSFQSFSSVISGICELIYYFIIILNRIHLNYDSDQLGENFYRFFIKKSPLIIAMVVLPT